MMTVAINIDAFAAAGLTYNSGNPVATFSFPDTSPLYPSAEVRVKADDTNLYFFPERSSSQKAVLAILGLA